MKLAPFIGRILLVALVFLSLYAFGWSVAHVTTVIRVVSIACVSAYLVNPVVKRLQSRGMSRDMAIAAVFLGFLSALGITLYLLVPVAQRQAALIGQQVQGFAADSDVHLARLQVVLEEELPGNFMEGRDLKTEVDTRLEELSGTAIAVVTQLLLAVASNLIYVFLLPMIVFILLQDGPFFYHQIVSAVPNRYFEVIYRLINRVDEQLGGYIRGVLIVTFCVGTVSTVGLWICGMKYFFIIGPLMGLLNMIPIFGPMVGMGIAAVAMIFQTGSPGAVVGPILVGVVSQVLDNVAFTPIAVSRSVDLHPLLVLVATLCGGELFGLVGLLLAVPATATIKVVWQGVREARESTRMGGRLAALDSS
ncbi:MAG: AI-2E family transporter [Gemmatimonadetes bacterium]|jgi:predicted PurR-regulated permease PerM|nr:AI-2E family transporter [Gemmatimonadota bacterium]